MVEKVPYLYACWRKNKWCCKLHSWSYTYGQDKFKNILQNMSYCQRFIKMMAIVLMCVFITARAGMTEFLAAVTPSASSNTTGCIRFSVYVGGLSPISGPPPTNALIAKLLDTLLVKTNFRCLLLNDMAGM
jgi:hypothetical protein